MDRYVDHGDGDEPCYEATGIRPNRVAKMDEPLLFFGLIAVVDCTQNRSFDYHAQANEKGI